MSAINTTILPDGSAYNLHDSRIEDSGIDVVEEIGANSTNNEVPTAKAIYDFYNSVKPTGELSITENGAYDVSKYASANVNVQGGGSGGIGSYEMIEVTGSGTLSQEIPLPDSLKGKTSFFVTALRDMQDATSLTTTITVIGWQGLYYNAGAFNRLTTVYAKRTGGTVTSSSTNAMVVENDKITINTLNYNFNAGSKYYVLIVPYL